ncbi:MAG: ribosome maturation factor RimM [Bacteroidia bacterium]
MEEPLQIGRLQRTYGLRGHIHFSITIDKEVMLDEMKFLLVSVNNQLIPFFIESIEDKSGKLTIKFENVDSESEAKKLVNRDIFTNPEFIGESEESELSQFIGYLVKDEVFGELGLISEIQEYPQHFIFVISYKGKEVLLPATDDLILNIDDEQKTIVYSAPEGLIELYLNA